MNTITCTICLSELEGVTVSLCGHPNHAMHEKCLKILATTSQDKCPTCRKEFGQSIVIQTLRKADDDTRLRASELHVACSLDYPASFFVARCKNTKREQMPTHQALRKPDVFLECGLKELVTEIRVEGSK